MYAPNHLHRRVAGNVAPMGWPTKNPTAPGMAKSVVWYPMGEGRGGIMFDRGETENMNGTIENNVTWTAGAFNNMVPNFGGTNGRVNCGNVQNLLGGTDKTIMFWMRPRVVSRGGIVFKNQPGTNWNGFAAIYNQANANLAVYINGSNANNSGGIVDNIAAAGELCHIAIIMRNDNTLGICKNGIAQTVTGAGTYTTPNENGQTMYLGYEQFTAASYFDGEIFGFEIVDEEMTEAEVFTRFEPQLRWQHFLQQDVPRVFGGVIEGGPPPTFVPAWAKQSTIGDGYAHHV